MTTRARVKDRRPTNSLQATAEEASSQDQSTPEDADTLQPDGIGVPQRSPQEGNVVKRCRRRSQNNELRFSPGTLTRRGTHTDVLKR